eukprot:359819-Chlamydomonas_euryale.AAC.1
MWSLGNEAGYGPAHDAMYAYLRSSDPSRPVHYEGGGSRTVATDVVCPMYARPHQLKVWRGGVQKRARGQGGWPARGWSRRTLVPHVRAPTPAQGVERTGSKAGARGGAISWMVATDVGAPRTHAHTGSRCGKEG